MDEKPLILVTGSSGLIGTRIICGLRGDFRVVGLDIKPSSETATDFIEADLTKDESVAKTLQVVREKHGERIASVVHLAAYYDFSGEPSPLYKQLTVEGTGRLVSALQRFEVEQFIFSSSLLVMKPAADDEKINERSPVQPEWDYPRSKVEAEEVLRKEHKKIPVVVLRIAGVYDEEGHSLPIGQQIKRIYEKDFESYFFPGDATHGQPFVHLNDLVDCIRKTIERRHDLNSFEVFLIAEPETMSYRDLQHQIGGELHGKEWPTIRIPKPVAKAGAWIKQKLPGEEKFIKPWMIDLADQNYPVEITRAQTRLDWRPQHRLHLELPKIISDLKQNSKQWFEKNKLPLPKDLQEES